MKNIPDKISQLSHQETAKLIADMFHRIVVHYGLWFAEVERQLGVEKALEIAEKVKDRSCLLYTSPSPRDS